MESKKRKALFPENHRGQELSTNAIILIVIGIIVLVVLILGFTIGWDKLLPFFSSNNVQNIQTSCSTACATSNKYDFCSAPRTLKASDITELGSNGKPLTERDGNCSFFATSPYYTKYAIADCQALEPC